MAYVTYKPEREVNGYFLGGNVFWSVPESGLPLGAYPIYSAPDTTEQYGYTFVEGEAVEVQNPVHLNKFSNNHFFEVTDNNPAKTRKTRGENGTVITPSFGAESENATV
jgi:hypothetical protein